MTHLPYAPWCQACVANRAREDRHQTQQENEDRGKNVIAFDFCYTYTGQEADEKQVVEEREDPVGKVEERQDQYGTCLVAASGETQAVLAVPVPSKGTASLKTVVEELIRFSIENSARDPVIFQADGERATRQILRTVQQVRKVMGLQTEIRITPEESHASNGLAERAVQSIRSRTIRRLASEQSFSGIDFHFCRGLPWAYSAQGILMKHAGSAQRYRTPAVEAEVSEQELEDVARKIASGFETPTVGNYGGLSTPGFPVESGLRTPAEKRSNEDADEKDENEKKAMRRSEAEEKEAKRGAKEKNEEEERAKKLQRKEGEKKDEEMTKEGESTSLTRKAEAEAEGSPSPKGGRLYPPGFAGINRLEVHGDEEEWEYLGGCEEGRLLEIPVMQKSDEAEKAEAEGYTITTKFVITWKHRVEKGGWFRRARLVARQFKHSIELEQTFAPTSAMIVPRLLMHLLVNVYSAFVAMTIDVKHAFLMAEQPEDEHAFVSLDDALYKLTRCLPGQRTAASQWFQLFLKTCKAFGLEADVMQPTLFRIPNELYLTVHVDDILLVGNPAIIKRFVAFLENEMKWSIEKKGHFGVGDRFTYLKRSFDLEPHGCVIRCDYKHYETLTKELGLGKKKYRSTPLPHESSKRDDSEELKGEEIRKFRSVVGRLMYISGERRPDAQFSIQFLAKHMSKPARKAMQMAWHLSSYLMGTMGYGIIIAKSVAGRSVLDVRDVEDCEAGPRHLLEVVCDADCAGNRNDRKSTSSFHLYLDGNLLESRVRSQRAIALRSGESEFVAMVSGSSDGMLAKHLIEFTIGESAVDMKDRSDSSAGRSMVQRHGVGRVRHLDASLLWIQQKEKERILSVTSIPSEINPSDIGTKILSKARLLALLFLVKMVDGSGFRLGEEQFFDIQEKLETKKSIKKVAKGIKGDLRVAAIMALASIRGSAGHEIKDNEGDARKESDNSDGSWMLAAFCTLAVIGALSLANILYGWMAMGMREMWNVFWNSVAHFALSPTSTKG